MIANLVFSHLGFWSGNLFLIVPFPDRCLLVPFHTASSLSLLYNIECNSTLMLLWTFIRFLRSTSKMAVKTDNALPNIL